MDDWQEQFYELFLKATWDGDGIGRAFDLKAPRVPGRLYRYRRVSPTSIREMATGIVELKSPVTFNDPFDSALSASEEDVLAETTRRNFDRMVDKADVRDRIGAAKLEEVRAAPDPLRALSRALLDVSDEIAEADKEILTRLVDEMIARFSKEPFQELFRAMRARMSVCCFTTDPKSILMWSHYAKNHSGMCIEYPTDELGADDIRRRMLFPVRYSSSRLDATQFILDAIPEGKVNVVLGIAAALIKSVEWSYEKEWRLVLPIEQRSYRLPRPRRVYLGACISDVDREAVEEAAQKRRIEVVRLELAYDAFRLDEGAAPPKSTTRPDASVEARADAAPQQNALDSSIPVSGTEGTRGRVG